MPAAPAQPCTCSRQPRSPETSSRAPDSTTRARLVEPHRAGDLGELDRERAAEPAAELVLRELDGLDARQRVEQRRAGARLAELAALVARAVERDGPRVRRVLRPAARRSREERAELAHATATSSAWPWRATSASNSSGQTCCIVATHEPESPTIGPSVAASASSVVAATRRASSGKPEFQAGWPQHVWPAGERDLVAGPAQHAHGGLARARAHEVDEAADEEVDARSRQRELAEADVARERRELGREAAIVLDPRDALAHRGERRLERGGRAQRAVELEPLAGAHELDRDDVRGALDRLCAP